MPVLPHGKMASTRAFVRRATHGRGAVGHGPRLPAHPTSDEPSFWPRTNATRSRATATSLSTALGLPSGGEDLLHLVPPGRLDRLSQPTASSRPKPMAPHFLMAKMASARTFTRLATHSHGAAGHGTRTFDIELNDNKLNGGADWSNSIDCSALPKGKDASAGAFARLATHGRSATGRGPRLPATQRVETGRSTSR